MLMKSCIWLKVTDVIELNIKNKWDCVDCRNRIHRREIIQENEKHKQGSHTAIKGGGERHNDKSTSEPIMARGVFASMVLFFDIDCKPGFEFHSEVVGKDGDLLDELFYQSFVELCDVCFLLGDKVLQFLDPVHGFFPVVAVDLGLFLLFPESEGFRQRWHRNPVCCLPS